MEKSNTNSGASKAMQMLAKMQAIKTLHKQLEQAQINATSCSVYARKLSELGVTSLEDLTDKSRDSKAILESLNLSSSDEFLINEALIEMKRANGDKTEDVGGFRRPSEVPNIAADNQLAPISKRTTETPDKSMPTQSSVSTVQNNNTNSGPLRSKTPLAKSTLTTVTSSATIPPTVNAGVSSDRNIEKSSWDTDSDTSSVMSSSSSVSTRIAPSAAAVLAKTRAAAAKQQANSAVVSAPNPVARVVVREKEVERETKRVTKDSAPAIRVGRNPAEMKMLSPSPSKPAVSVVQSGTAQANTENSESSEEDDDDDDEESEEESDDDSTEDDDDDVDDDDDDAEDDDEEESEEEAPPAPAPAPTPAPVPAHIVERNQPSKVPITTRRDPPISTNFKDVSSDSAKTSNTAALPATLLHAQLSANKATQRVSATQSAPVNNLHDTSTKSTIIRKPAIQKNRALTKAMSSGSESSDDEKKSVKSTSSSKISMNSSQRSQVADRSKKPEVIRNEKQKVVASKNIRIGDKRDAVPDELIKTAPAVPAVTNSVVMPGGTRKTKTKAVKEEDDTESLYDDNTADIISTVSSTRGGNRPSQSSSAIDKTAAVEMGDKDDDDLMDFKPVKKVAVPKDSSTTPETILMSSPVVALPPTNLAELYGKEEDEEEEEGEGESEDKRGPKRRNVSTAFFNNFALPLQQYKTSQPELQHVNKKRIAFSIKTLSTEEAADVNKAIQNLQRAIDSRDPVSARQASAKIADLCLNDPSKQNALGELGACAMITSLLWGWLKEPAALEAALCACAALCKDRDSASSNNVKNILALRQAGALDMVVGTMQRNISSPMICEFGCLALTNLAYDEEERTGLGTAGGCEVVMSVLQEHMSNVRVVERATFAVMALTKEKGNVLTLNRLDVSKTMVAVLNLPVAQSTTLTAAACTTLGNIGSYRECIEKLVEAQGDQALIEALFKWSETHDVASACFLSLSKIAVHETCRKALVRFGVCEAVYRSIRALMPVEDVAVTAAICISELVNNSKATSIKFMQFGVCEILVEALALHDLPAVDETVCWAIYRLCLDNPEIVNHFGSLGICSLISTVLERNIRSGNEVTVPAALAVVSMSASGNVTNQASFALTSVSRLIMMLLDDEWSDFVQVRALWAIALLCRSSTSEDSVNEVNVAHFMMANIHTEFISLLSAVVEATVKNLPISIDFVEALCWATRNVCMLYAHAFGRRTSQLVLEVLSLYRSEPRITIPVCGILRWMTTAKDIVLSGDGTAICVAVTQVFEDYMQNAAVCEAACGVALQLSAYDEVVEVFVSLGVCAHVVRVLETHSGDEKMTLVACATIHDLAGSCSLASQKIFQCNGCDILIKAMKFHISSVEICDTVCCSIHTIGVSSNSERVDAFNAMDAGVLVIDALKEHVNSKALAVHACRALWVLTIYTIESRQAIGARQGCQTIIESMRRYYDNMELASHACRAIYSLCKSVPENIDRFSSLDSYAVVMSVLQRAFSSQDVFLVGITSRAVMALCFGNAKNQERFGGIGACELIAGCLFSSWMRGIWNIEGLLLAVAFLCRSDSTRSSTNVRNLNLLVAGGVIKITIRELRKFKHVASFAKAGCIAVRNLAYDLESKVKLGEESACDAVFDAFNEHGRDPEVVEYAAGAIANLAGNIENVVTFMDLGVYQLITEKLLTFVNSETVTIACCSAIVNLASGNEENSNLKRQQQDLFGALEIHELLVVALDMHKNSPKLAVAACGSIMNLTEGNAESATVFGSAGACEAVSRALALHGEHSEAVTAAACSAIWCLAMGNSKNKRRFGTLDTCEMVVNVLVQHMASSAAAEHACLAIRHLADGNTDNSGKLGGCGACEAVIKVLSIHVGDTSVAEAASGAVVSLSTNNRENAKRLGGFGASDEVVRSLQKAISSRDETLASTSASAVSRLTSASPDNQQALGTAGACELMIELLQCWKKKPRIEATILAAIASLCRYGADRSTANALNISRMVKVGALEIILKKLKDFLPDSDVCDAGCLALRNLAHEEEHQSRLGVLGGCDIILGILRKHMSLPDVTEKVCGAISNLALISYNAKYFAENDVFSFLGQAFFMHLGILDTAIAICGAVVNLTANGMKESASIMESSGIFKSIVKALNVHIESPYMGTAVCLAIANLIHICQGQSRDEFIALGACEAIVAVFQHNSDNPRVVTNACRATYHIAFENNTAKDRFGRLGACEMITRGLLAHFENEEICDNACLAVRNLSANHPENKSRFGGIGCCRAVIKALVSHPSSLAVAEAACLAVRNMSGGHPENVSKFGEADAVKVLRGVLQNHVSSETVVEQACASLANIVANNEPLKAQLSVHNTAEPIVLALQVHHSDAKILAHVCLLLANMAGDNVENATQLLDRGACETLVLILQKNLSSGILCENACSAISNMAFNEESISRLTSTGACDAISNALSTHVNIHQGVNEAAADAISALAVGRNIEMFGELGVCTALAEALSVFNNEIAVVIPCSMAITKLATLDRNVLLLRETEICDSLTQMIKIHMGSDAALVVACDAIDILTRSNLDNQSIFGETGLAQLLMQVINMYPNFPEVITSVSRVIANVAKNEVNRASFGRLGACSGLVRVLADNAKDTPSSTVICRAIAKVADSNQPNRMAFNKEGAPSTIHSLTINNFQGDVGLMVACFEAIWKLVEDCEANLEIFTSFRFASIVVENLRTHMKVWELCEMACGAVSQLALHPVNDSEMRSLGVCDLIVDGISLYIDIPAVIITASLAVAKLSISDKNNAVLMSARDLPKHLTVAFQKHIADPIVTKEVLSAISNFCLAEEKIQEKFDASEISHLLSTATINHTLNTDVLTELCRAIASLSKTIYGIYHTGANFESQVLVNVLNTNVKYRKLAINACSAIANLAMTDPSLSDILGGAGALESALVTMKIHDEDPEVLAVVALAIDKLCAKSSTNAILIGDIGGPAKLTEIIRKMTLVESVIPNLCSAVHSACGSNFSNRSSFGAHGACELLLDVLRSHKTIDNCVINVCNALYALGVDYENRNVLVSLGASDIVMPIIELHNTRGSVMASLFLFLSSIVVPGSKESMALGKDINACNSVISAFRNHNQNPSLVADVSRVIHCLTFGQEETARLMGTAGVCELLAHSFKDFFAIPETVERICYAIGSMQAPQNITKLKNLGIVGMLIKAMKTYLSQGSVVEAVSFAIRYFAGDDKVNDSFAEYGTAEIIIEGLTTHSDDSPDVAAQLCWALRQITFNQSRNVNLVHAFKHKGCQLVLRVLRRHSNSPNIALAALWMVRILASEVDGRSELGDLNACETTIQALEANAKHGNVVTQCFWVINNLCSLGNESNMAKFTQCDAALVIGAALKVNVAVAEAAEQGSIVIRVLSEHDPKNISSFVKAGACETVMEGLVGHMQNAAIVEHALAAIRVLLREKGTLNKFITLGTIRTVIQVGRTHGEVFEVCEQVCMAISAMILQDRSLAVKFGEVECCDLMNEILKDHNRIQTLITHCCTTVSLLCFGSPSNSIALGNSRLMDSMLSGFQRYLNSPAVCKSANDAIHSLCLGNESNASKLGQLGVCDMVVTTLQKYRTQNEIVESALCAVWHLSQNNPENRERIGAANGCEEVLYALKDYIQLPGIALAACAAVWHLADGHLMNRHRFEALNATGEVQKVLKIHLEREDVTRNACGALWSMVVNASNEEGTSVDGCRAVVNALILHLESPGLAEVGCIAMANMASNLGSVGTLGVVGACDTVVKTLVAHIRDTIVVEAACGALSTLSLNNDNKNRLHVAGANKVILNALQVHVDKDKTSVALLSVIAKISEESPQNASKFVNLGVCDLFTLLLKLHPDSSEIKAKICESVVVLATFAPELLQLFGDSGLCEAIVTIMKSNLNSSHSRVVCEHACKAACQMAFHMLNLKKLIDSGALLAIVQLVQSLPDIPNIVIACAALTKFMTSEDLVQRHDYQTRLADAGMCEALVQTLGVQLEKPNVLKMTCQALISLGFENESNKVKIFEAGVYGGVTAVLEKHATTDAALGFSVASVIEMTCFTTEHQTAYGDCGLCQSLALAFQTVVEARDEQTSERVGRAIVAIIVGHPENQVRMGTTHIAKTVVSMLWGWVKNVIVEEVALWIVAFLCRSGKSSNTTCMENVTALRVAGIYDGVMGSMRRHVNNPKLCQAGCWVIRNLAFEIDHVIRLQGAGACEASAAALLTHVDDANVVEAAAGAIANIAVIEDCITRFFRMDVCQGLARALASNYGSSEVAINIFASVQNLALSSMEVRDTFASVEIISTMAHIASNNASDVAVLTMFCGAVESLASGHENNRSVLGRKGTCEIIIQALVNFSTNEPLVTQGCGAIKSLTENSRENSLRFGEVNGCETVVVALEMHLSNEALAIKACQAIRHLATGSEKNMKRLCAANAPDIIIRALRSHEGSVIIAEAASWALRTISTTTDIHTEFGERRACETVISALKTHLANAPATEQNLAAVVNLTIDPTSHAGNIEVFYEIGLCEVVVDVLRRYMKVPEVCLQACWVVENIANSKPEFSKTFGDCGACESIVAILRRHIQLMDVAERVCLAIFKLCNEEANVVMLGSAGACEAVSNVLQTANQLQAPKVASAACKVICGLTTYSAANQDAFGMAGCCRFISTTLAGWLADLELLEYILMAIALLCRHGKGTDTVNEFNSAIFSEQRTDECIVRFLKKIGHTPKLARAASIAIRCLAYDKDTRIRFGELGVCGILPIMLLQYGESNWDSGEATAAAIATLAVIPENKALLSEAGATDAVLSVLASVLDKEDVVGGQIVERCCWALQNLSLDNKTYSEKLGRDGVCEVLVLTLKKFTDHDGSVVLSACGAIWNISNGSPENKLKFCQCGLAASLVKALQQYDGENSHSVAIAGAIRSVTSHKETPEDFVTNGASDALVKALRKHVKNASVVEQIGGAIANIVAADDRSKDQLETAGVCETIVGCMRRHSDNVVISAISCRVVGNLAKSSDTAARLGSIGACESVTNSLRRFGGEVAACQQACYAMRNLAQEPENRSMLGLSGACELLTATLRKFNDSRLVAEQICGAITNLSSDHSENNNKLNLSGASELVTTTLRTHVEVSLVVEQACRAISVLAINVNRRYNLGVLGVCEAIISSLERHLYDARVLVSVINSMCSVASGTVECQHTFGVNRGCELLSKALGIHKLRPDVTEQILYSIYALSENNSANMKRFAEASVFDGVISALYDHQEVGWVCSAACRAIHALSLDESNLWNICSLRAAERICLIFRSHINDANVVVSACNSIAALTRNESQYAVLRNNSVCVLVVDAFNKHVADLSTMRAILETVSALSKDPTNAVALGKSNLCAMLSSLLEEHKHSADMVAILTYTIYRLLTAPQNCMHFGTATTYNNLIENMQRHGNDPTVAVNSCLVMQILALSGEQKMLAGSAGGCEGLVNALLSHVLNTELVKGVCKALVSICDECEGNVERAGSAGVCDLLMSLLQRHADHSSVVSAIFETIKALATSTLNKEKFGGQFTGVSGCEIIGRYLAMHVEDPETVQHGCEAIVAMCKDSPINAMQFGQNDTHLMVLQTMQKHIANEKCAGASSAALWSLAYGYAGNNARIAEAGAISVLVEALRRHGSSAMVCGGSCGALSVILDGNDVYLGTLKAVDARRAVIGVLGVHFEDFFAAQSCLHLLRVMYEKGKEENLMPSEGECQVIVKCLNAHLSNTAVAEEACSVISVLGSNLESPSSKLFGEAGACHVVCAALERSITNKTISLALSACRAVVGLLRGNSTNQEELGTAGACRQIILLLSLWSDVGLLEKLEDAAMSCVVFLCRHDKDKSSTSMGNIERFRAVGACEAVSLMLEKRMERPILVEWTCRAIANLASDSGCCTRLVTSGTCELTTRALRIHQEVFGVAEFASAAIANLATSETSRNVLALSGACEAVVAILFRRCDLLSMATQACVAIQNLASGDQENKSRLGGAGACKAVTMVLQAHHEDTWATLSTLGAMVNLVANHPVNADRLVAAGACDTVVRTWDKLHQNESICKTVFMLVRSLSVNSDRRRTLRDVGACEVATQSLRYYVTHDTISGIGCGSIAALVEDDVDNMALLGRLGICQLAVEALVSHAGNHKVAENACNLVLALASRSAENRTKLIASGAPDAIIKILDKNIESPAVAMQACKVVRFLASDAMTRAKLSVAGACPRVIEMLKRHLHEPTVSGLACSAIHALADSSIENRELLANVGGCELVATALQTHVDDCDAARDACLAIVSLSDSNSSNLAKLSTRQVCLSLSAVFQRHRGNADLAEAASRAIKNMASLPESRTFLGRNGVCQPLADAMMLHLKVPQVIKAIAWAAFWLATDEKLNSENLGSVGACEGIVKALRAHIDDSQTVEACISTVWTLAANVQSNKVRLGTAGACEVVTSVLSKYSTHRDITRPTLVAMRNLASNNLENKLALGSAGACTVVVKALASQSSDTVQVEQACGVMANLANSNTANATLLSQAGCAEVLADILKSYVGHTAIMKQSCLIVCHMASANIPQLKFRELGVCDSIVKVLSAHVSSNVVNAAACAAVRAMSFDPESKTVLGESGVCAAVCKALSVGLEVQDAVVVEEAVHTVTVLTRGCASHQDIFGNSGVCEMLLRILKNGYAYEVNEKVIWAIAYLCRHDTHVKSTNIRNVMKFTDAGIGQMILPLLQTYGGNDEFVLAGCITIRNICSLECNVLQIGQLQGCEIITAIIKRYHQFDNICEAACGAIANLAKGDCRMMFNRAGVCQLLAQLLSRYSEKPNVMEQICGCISNLATDCQENKQVFGDCETCEAVVRVLRKHNTIPAVSLRACMTIRNLASNHASNKARLGAAGACEAVVGTLKMYASNPALVEVCDSAIRALATGNAENSNRIVAAGGPTGTEGVFSKPPQARSQPEVQDVSWKPPAPPAGTE